jgi:hypothetical protein
MLKSLQIAVVLIMVALIPARAIGAAMVSICAAGQAQEQSHSHPGQQVGNHADHEQHEGPKPAEPGHSCGNCATHCAGAAFAAPMDPVRIVVAAALERTPFGARLPVGYFADLLDRPPLVS